MYMEERLHILMEYTPRDTAELILKFLYPQCKYCRMIMEYLSMTEMYSGDYICFLCKVDNTIKKCGNCQKLYILKENLNCNMCHNSPCLVYCPLCLREDYTKIY